MDFRLFTQFPEELKDDWNALLAHSDSHVPFLRFEYLRDWWSTRGGGEWPETSQLAIIAGYEGARLVGIAPLFITGHEDQRRLMLLGSIEISDFLDLICCPEDLSEFVWELLTYVRKEMAKTFGIKAIDLYNLLENTPTLPALQSASSRLGLTSTVEKLQHSPFIPLPGDWETYLAGIDKKQRHEIRRKMRRAEESDIPVSMYITEDPTVLEADMEDFLNLMAQDAEKAAFLKPQMRAQMKLTMRCAFKAGCLQLAFLVIGESKAAVYLNFDFLDRIWVYNSGLDRRFLEYSPGWVLLGHLMRWAIEHGRSEFDFMRGSEDYKYRFGAIDRFIVRVKIDLSVV